MVFSSMPSSYNLDPTSNWNHHQDQQQLGSNNEVHHHHHHPRPSYIPLQLPPPYPQVLPSQPPAIHHQGVIRPGSMTDQARKANLPIPETIIKCPRCASMNTKFCYYNNYSLSQPRYFCKNCRRYWTHGGSLRNVPVGGGCRKNNKRSSSSKGGSSTSTTRSKSPSSHSGSTPSNYNTSACYSSSHHLIRNNGISHIQPSPVSLFMAPLNHLSDHSIADIGANYPGVLIPQVSSSPDHFNLMLGNVNTVVPSSSGMESWRLFQQQQVQQYQQTSFFDEVPHSAAAPLYGMESHVTARERESNEHKLLISSRNTCTAGGDAQLERNINSCYNGANRGQFMARPLQYNWSNNGAASENSNANNNDGNSSSAPTIAWTDLISGFNSTSSTSLHPS